MLVDPNHSSIPLTRQLELLDLPRSTHYYKPIEPTEETLKARLNLKNAIDRIYTECPFYGARKISKQLRIEGVKAGRELVGKLMKDMGIKAIYPKPKTSQTNKQHKIYPYLLRGVDIERPNQVWSSDITYIGLKDGFVYLTAVVDWYSRVILSWELSNSLDSDFCQRALERAFEVGKPEIFNTDQGSQYTCSDFTDKVEARGVKVSMDGKGRALDNVFIERFWRSIKYENIYIKGYENVCELRDGLARYMVFYNFKRIHESLCYRTPAQIHGLDAEEWPMRWSVR